jgi:two-component system sensor histidine kinase SenX3
MSASDTLYAVLLVLSAAVALLVAVIAWRRRSAPGALGLFLFEASAFVWSSSYTLQWVLTDHGPSRFWLAVRLVGVLTAPMAALIMVLGYTGRRRWLSGARLAVLLTVPLVLVLLAATDPFHHLYLGSGAPEMRVTAGGPLVVVATAYGLALLVAGILLLARAAVRQHRVYRLQSAMLIVALAVPMLTTLLEAAGFHAFRVINATPIVFTLTGPLLAFALFRLGLLGLVPVARDRIIEDLRDGIIVLDSERRVVDVNPAAVRMTGVTQDDIGRDFDDVFASSSDAAARLRDSLDADGTAAEISAPGAPDRVLEVSASPMRESRGRRIATIATVRDVTERARLATELKARTDDLALALERSSLVLAALTEGVVLVDGDGTLVSSNPAIEHILRIRRAVSPGTPAAELSDALPLEALAAQAREAGAPVTQTVHLAGGRSIGVEVIPLDARGPGRPQTLFVIRDETERAAALRMQRDFISNVSHELQTPLTGLSLLADTLPRALRDDPGRVDGFVRQLGSEVRRVTRIAESLLTLSRVEELGSSVELPQTRVDLSRLVAEEADGISPLAAQKRQHLAIESARGVWVTGDEPSLCALIGALLENAVHYTPVEGHVAVRTEVVEDDGRAWAVLVVTDDGVGISEDDQQRVFERFYRVDKARSRATGGTGLGLSIVQQTAERHGGTVSVASRPGLGSTFTVRIPADA